MYRTRDRLRQEKNKKKKLNDDMMEGKKKKNICLMKALIEDIILSVIKQYTS